MAVISLLTMTLLLSACGGAAPTTTGSNPAINANPNGTTTVTTSEGTMQTGGNLPADWPADVQVYPNATIQFSASQNPATGKAGFGLVMMSQASASDVVAFYQKTLAGNGWTIDGTVNSAGTSVITAKKDTRSLGLSVTGSDQGTSVTIGIDMGQVE